METLDFTKNNCTTFQNKNKTMIYPIIAYGDEVLRLVAVDIEKNTPISDLVDSMFETMYSASGIGLAAPQIGKSLRLFVADGTKYDEEDVELKDFKKVFVNPTILEETGKLWAFEEGCLSIPSVRDNVKRPEKVKIHYFDENWNEFTEEFIGMAARIIQHEYDHIQGVLFTDYMTPLKKKLLKNKLTNISKGNVDVDYRMKFPLLKGRY